MSENCCKFAENLFKMTFGNIYEVRIIRVQVIKMI